MQKSNRRIVIKQSNQLQSSAKFAMIFWIIRFLSRHFINHQQSKKLMVHDVFTVSQTIELTNNQILRSDMNYLVCDVGPAIVMVMPLDSIDDQPFKVSKKAIKRALIRKDM